MFMNDKIMFDRYYCINSTKHCENEENIAALYLTSSPKGNDRSPDSKSSNYLKSPQVKDFLNCSRAANSAVHGWILPNFKLIRNYIFDLVTCKNDKDSIKTEGARVLARL